MHINILLQNIDLLAPADIEPLRALAEEITCTTAHDNYSTSEQSERFGIPLHKFSVHLNQSCFERSTWSAKENIMVLSPDANVVRDAVVAHIAANVPKLELVTVQNMSYESYKALVRRAKWSLTFGEGLDGYFAETAWTGGVPFAVFNDRFFTPDFRGLRTVYESWDALIGAIADDISALDRSDVFDTTNDAVRKPLNHLYDFGRYKDNIRAFYEERYSFGGAGRENGSLAVEAILPHVRGGAGWMRRRTELIATMRKEGRFN